MYPKRRPARARCVTLVAALAIGLAACGSDDERTNSAPGGSGDAEAPIKIGVAGGKTGFMSFFDAPVLAGAEIAVDDINADGGIEGRRLELVTSDNKSDVNQIVPAARSVLDKDAEVLITSCDYDFGGPAAREANKRGVLAIGCAGAPLYGLQGIGPLTFNTYPGTPTEGAVMVKFAHSRGWRGAYMLEDTSLEYSKAICRYVEERWRALGGTVAGKDTFQNADASIRSQVTRLKGASADVVFLCSYPPGGAAAVKQLRAGGIDTPIVGGAAFDGTYWLEGIPDLSNFYSPAHGSLAGDDPVPERTELFERFETKTGKPPSSATYPIMGYAAIQTIARAIQESGGSTNGEDLRKAIESFKDVPLLSGPTTYTPTCHIPLGRPMAMIEIQDGEAAFAGELEPEAIPKSPC